MDSRKELIENFLSSKIDYKDHIKIQGKLIDYAHLYKPKSYINSINDNNPDQDIPLKIESEGKTVLNMAWKPFQMPISRIPSVHTEDGLLSLSFLYPLDFESFIYDGFNGFTANRLDEPTFKIPDNAKPIPILLKKEDSVKFQFENVEITGRVVPLPDQLIEKLIGNKFSSMTFSEIVNPLNTRMPSLCLSLNTNKGQIKKIKSGNRLNQCKASIFIESHIEGMASEKLISKIPDLSSKAFTGNKGQFSTYYNDFTDQLPTIFQLDSTPETNVNIIGKFPNILGFYIEGNILNLEEDYLKFTQQFNRFTNNLHDMVPSFSIHIDFMHDFSLKSYLDSPLLNSKSSLAVRESELQETIQWLKHNNSF
ncbi:hypothetical protein PD280_06030 [Virgibacillus salarius]|uniref:hypothetical protein n=1 Tax=Virgibacillus salarius TaxID=447199 RepID=UPI002492610F|nr:hypothetical protein [Virgibacillus salarius]WBX81278.1 hypothetical protein PD280_06030 [Virgibacillus salarius]